MAPPFSVAEVAGFRAEAEIPFTMETQCGNVPCEVPLDVIAPPSAEAAPTVVILNGGPVPFHERRNPFMNRALVEEGLVVFVAAYRNRRTGNTQDAALDDIRCAVRFARDHTQEYGGDPERIVVVGQSYGSYYGLQAALEPDEDPGICLSNGSGVPDLVIGLAGFGVQERTEPADTPPLWFVAGSEDFSNTLTGRDDVERLQEAGYDVTYHEIEGADHPAMFDPEATPEVIEIILDAIATLPAR